MSHLDMLYTFQTAEAIKEHRAKAIEAAKERRRLYRHIANYPVKLIDEITRDGSMTVAEREELAHYLYGR